MFRTFSKNSDKRLTMYELAYPNLNKKKKKGKKKPKTRKETRHRSYPLLPF